MNFASHKNLYIKRLIFTALIFLAALFQNTSGALPVIKSAHAFVLIPLIVSISMNEKSIPSMFFGILAGTLWDFASPSIDGYYAILFCVIAFVSSILISFVMRNNIYTSLLLSFFAIVIVSVFNWIFFIVSKHYDSGLYTLTNYYLPSGIFTFVFTPICYAIVRPISTKFKEDEHKIN